VIPASFLAGIKGDKKLKERDALYVFGGNGKIAKSAK